MKKNPLEFTYNNFINEFNSIEFNNNNLLFNIKVLLHVINNLGNITQGGKR